MENDKVISKVMELPLEDGTGAIVDELAKQREEIKDAANKEFKDRAEIMDDINNAEGANTCSKAFNVKVVTEKLTLDESDEKQLNEDYDDSYDKLVHDLFGAMHKVLTRTYLGELSLEEVLDAVDEATMRLEDLMMEDDNGGVYVEESLDEALPRDLAKAYRSNPFEIGVGNKKSGYNNIVNSRSEVAALTGYNSRTPADIDFKNSNYTEITPEEALKVKKEGNVDKLRIIFDGQLVAFNDAGKPIYKASKNWNSNRDKYRKEPDAPAVDHTTQLPFKTLLNNADKIYLADEKPVDKDLQAARAKNPESRYYADRDATAWGPERYNNSNLVNYQGNEYRGAGYSVYNEDSYKRAQKQLDKIKKALAYAEGERDKLVALRGDSDTNQEDLENKIRRLEDNVNFYKREVKERESTVRYYANLRKDHKAHVRNLASKQNLEGVIKDFFKLKSEYKNYKNKLDNANSYLGKIKDSGSPEVIQRKEELKVAQQALLDLNKKIARLELYLESADEDNAAEVAKASKAVDELTGKLDSVTDKLTQLKTKKKEGLEDKEGQPLDEEAKVISSFSNYKPWSGAVDTYNTIEDAGMLDEFEAMIEDLYPEGIDETQLNDILWFESDWIYETLGISEG